MNTKKRFLKHYQEGYMPWAHEQADFNLVDMVNQWPIKPGKTLELGCGTGTDAIWLSSQGFEVTALDVSPIAIELAKQHAEKENSECHFREFDFLNEPLGNGSFDFIFDRGYFHSYDSEKKRIKIAKRVADYLSEDGLWLSLIGSTDCPPRKSGPPMRSAANIINAVEPFLEIQVLMSSVFGNEQENPAKIWVCLMKKRK